MRSDLPLFAVTRFFLVRPFPFVAAVMLLTSLPVFAEVFETEKMRIRVEAVVTDLQHPWATTMLPDGRLLITERPGTLRLVENGKLHPEPVQGIPEVLAIGQGGMMEVQLHPEYETNGWIYLGYSKPIGAGGLTAIMRGRLENHAFVDQEMIFDPPPEQATGGSNHWGVRIRFDDQKFLFFGIGDRGGPTKGENEAQNLRSVIGTILRLHDDGRIPSDNPFLDRPDVPGAIWAYGVRNPQGLAFQPRTGLLWETEHGPRGGDELNIIKKGANYGWPVVSYGINYNGSVFTSLTEKEGMEPPVYHWTPSIGICGMDFVDSDAFASWKGNILVTGLSGGYVGRLELQDNKVLHEERLLEGRGRMRDVRVLRDGLIYVTMDGPMQVLRLSPAD